jgi:hypothetical protein
MSSSTRRLSLVLAGGLVLFPLLVGADGPTAKPASTDTIIGKVVPLAGLVAEAGTQLDADAGPYWLVLTTSDGKMYPLVKNGGSRLFFKDKELLHRPMRLTGRLLPGSQMLHVMAVQSLIKGEPHEVYYWCDICSIKRGEKDICECCGGPMQRHEDPIKK